MSKINFSTIFLEIKTIIQTFLCGKKPPPKESPKDEDQENEFQKEKFFRKSRNDMEPEIETKPIVVPPKDPERQSLDIATTEDKPELTSKLDNKQWIKLVDSICELIREIDLQSNSIHLPDESVQN